MSDNQPSTLKSYVDSATGTIQSALGSMMGSTDDKTEGQAKQEEAKAESDASHATAKVPGFSASSSGVVTRDDPDRTRGAWSQTVGSAKEFTGNLVGSESLKQSGREQNLSGQQQEARGQLNDLGSGMADRVTGTVGSAWAGLTGDREGQAEHQTQHDVGKSQQRGVEYDLQKRAEAQQSRQ